tara:strand:- start:722 stop:1024 length:303 start_codon:yes stop_codon:yes gene_type:complete
MTDEDKKIEKALYVKSHHNGKPTGITKDMVNMMNKKQGYKFRLRIKLPNIKLEKFVFLRTMNEAEELVRQTNATLIEVKETDKMPTENYDSNNKRITDND